MFDNTFVLFFGDKADRFCNFYVKFLMNNITLVSYVV